MPDVETPCIKICILDPMSGLCRGCGRTPGEIERWASLQAAERRWVMADLPRRLAALGRAAAGPA
jgi:predicted Fe-S protein YdhL (DUF1289 family)